MKTSFFCDQMSLDWLRETHLKREANLPVFQSFVLTGNEDCPTYIDLYSRKLARIGDKPVAVFVLTDDLTYRRE